MRQMAKRVSGLLLAALLLCGSVLAAGETYVIEGKGVEITELEGDYYILTRDMDPGDPALANMGYTSQQVNDMMEQGGDYYVAVARDYSYELHVGVLESEEYTGLSDYDMIGRHRRDEIAGSVAAEFERTGITLTKAPFWYEEGEVPYMVVEVADTEEHRWSYQYQTLYAGRMVVISATSVSLKQPTEAIREATRQLVECVHYPYRIVWLQSLVKAFDGFEDMIGTVAVIVIAGILGCGRWNRLRKKRKKSMSAVPAENEANTGGDDL